MATEQLSQFDRHDKCLPGFYYIEIQKKKLCREGSASGMAEPLVP